MKNFNQDILNKKNERVKHLLAELNSTLDLYYEKVNKNDAESQE